MYRPAGPEEPWLTMYGPVGPEEPWLARYGIVGPESHARNVWACSALLSRSWLRKPEGLT
jgi:hypothetical protein